MWNVERGRPPVTSVYLREAGPRWLWRPMRVTSAGIRLVTVPSAGGAPSMYRSLAARLTPDVEVWAVQLPGRERRFGEPVPQSLAAIVSPLVTAIRETIEPPFAILGHSMGSLIAFEVCRQLHAMDGPRPERLLVSAYPAPHLPLWQAGTPRHVLPDEQLLRWLAEAGGMPAAVLADASLMSLLLPVIRADLRACESHVYRPAAPLPVPVTAFAGAHDPLVPVEHVAAWERHTDGDFGLHVLPGGHFHLQAGEAAFAGRVRAALT